MLVVFYHRAHWLLEGAPRALRDFVGSGFVGVGLFFVLSGFILAYTYAPAQLEGRFNRRAFWAARVARVYPVYLVALVIALPFFVGGVLRRSSSPIAGLLTVAGVATNGLLLTQAWVPQYACTWNCPGWSLSVEAFFYLLFPLLCAWFCRLRGRQFAIVFLGAWASLMVAPVAYVRWLPDGVPVRLLHDTPALWLSALKYSPLLHLPEFVMGVAVGAWYVRRGSAQSSVATVSSYVLPVLIASVLAWSSHLPYPLLHNGLLAPAFAGVILALALGGGQVRRFLSLPGMVKLGEASYALYLVHVPLYSWLDWATRSPKFDGRYSVWFFVGYVLLAIAMSLAIYRYVEEPARRWLRERLARRPETVAAELAELRVS